MPGQYEVIFTLLNTELDKDQPDLGEFQSQFNLLAKATVDATGNNAELDRGLLAICRKTCQEAATNCRNEAKYKLLDIILECLLENENPLYFKVIASFNYLLDQFALMSHVSSPHGNWANTYKLRQYTDHLSEKMSASYLTLNGDIQSTFLSTLAERDANTIINAIKTSDESDELSSILRRLKSDGAGKHTLYSKVAFELYFIDKSIHSYLNTFSKVNMEKLLSFTPFLRQQLGEGEFAQIPKIPPNLLLDALKPETLFTTYKTLTHPNDKMIYSDASMVDHDNQWMNNYVETLKIHGLNLDITNEQGKKNIKVAVMSLIRFSQELQPGILSKILIALTPNQAPIDLLDVMLAAPVYEVYPVLESKNLLALLNEIPLDEASAKALFITMTIHPGLKPFLYYDKVTKLLLAILNNPSLESLDYYTDFVLLLLERHTLTEAMSEHLLKPANDQDKVKIDAYIKKTKLTNLARLLSEHHLLTRGVLIAHTAKDKPISRLGVLITAVKLIYPELVNQLTTDNIADLTIDELDDLADDMIKKIPVAQYFACALKCNPDFDRMMRMLLRHLALVPTCKDSAMLVFGLFKTMASHYNKDILNDIYLALDEEIKAQIDMMDLIKACRNQTLTYDALKSILTDDQKLELIRIIHRCIGNNDDLLNSFLPFNPGQINASISLQECQMLGIDLDAKLDIDLDLDFDFYTRFAYPQLSGCSVTRLESPNALSVMALALLFSSCALQKNIVFSGDFTKKPSFPVFLENLLKLIFISQSGRGVHLPNVHSLKNLNNEGIEAVTAAWTITKKFDVGNDRSIWGQTNWNLHFAESSLKCLCIEYFAKSNLDGPINYKSSGIELIRKIIMAFIMSWFDMKSRLRQAMLCSDDMNLVLHLLKADEEKLSETQEFLTVRSALQVINATPETLTTLSNLLDASTESPSPRAAILYLALQPDLDNASIHHIANKHLNINYAGDWNSPAQTAKTLALLSNTNISTLKQRIVAAVKSDPTLKSTFMALVNEPDEIINQNVLMHIVKASRKSHMPKETSTYTLLKKELKKAWVATQPIPASNNPLSQWWDRRTAKQATAINHQTEDKTFGL